MIRRQSGYMLRKIEDSWQLLPFGQRIADQKHGMILNETGADIWNLLEFPKSKEELIRLLAEKYEISEEEYAELAEDIERFLDQLLAFGVLRETCPAVEQPFYQELCIADLRIAFYGEPEWFPEAWNLFEAERTECYELGGNLLPDQKIELIPYRLPERQNGTILLQNKELTVCQTEDGYVLDFPTMENIRAVELSEDGSRVRMYMVPEDTEESRENIFHAVRHCFLYLAQKKGLYAIHSASLLYRGKAWLFSGHSGAGKSTHTNLWNGQFETPILNGDLNLVGEQDGNLLVYGIPWCGTSGICTTEAYPLGGIVLLAQDAQNRIETLTKTEKTLRVMQRMISPAWLPGQLDRNLEFAEKIIKQIPVCSYRCTKEPEAAVYLKETFVDIEKSGK